MSRRRRNPSRRPAGRIDAGEGEARELRPLGVEDAVGGEVDVAEVAQAPGEDEVAVGREVEPVVTAPGGARAAIARASWREKRRRSSRRAGRALRRRVWPRRDRSSRRRGDRPAGRPDRRARWRAGGPAAAGRAPAARPRGRTPTAARPPRAARGEGPLRCFAARAGRRRGCSPGLRRGRSPGGAPPARRPPGPRSIRLSVRPIRARLLAVVAAGVLRA